MTCRLPVEAWSTDGLPGRSYIQAVTADVQTSGQQNEQVIRCTFSVNLARPEPNPRAQFPTNWFPEECACCRKRHVSSEVPCDGLKDESTAILTSYQEQEAPHLERGTAIYATFNTYSWIIQLWPFAFVSVANVFNFKHFFNFIFRLY